MKGTGKVPRSQATRDRILESARALFSQVGFERATIRAIALDAKIHPSLVMRYYGSKEGLFVAAMSFDLRLPDLSVVPAKQRGAALARHFLARWDGTDRHGELPALLRIAVTHPTGKQKLFDVFTEQLLPGITKVVPGKRARTSAAFIATQAIGLAFARYVIEIPVVVALSPEQIIVSLGEAFQRHL